MGEEQEAADASMGEVTILARGAWAADAHALRLTTTTTLTAQVDDSKPQGKGRPSPHSLAFLEL